MSHEEQENDHAMSPDEKHHHYHQEEDMDHDGHNGEGDNGGYEGDNGYGHHEEGGEQGENGEGGHEEGYNGYGSEGGPDGFFRGRGRPPFHGGFRGGFRGRGAYPPYGGAPPPFFRGRGFPPGMGPPGRGRGFMPPPYMRGRGYAPRGYPGFRGGMYGGYPPYGAPGGFMQGQAAIQPNPAEQEGRLRKLAGCEEGEELWVETESDGKTYYYHPMNRNTVWEKPDNAKIIDQSELAQLISRSAEEEKKEREEREQQGQQGGAPFGRGGAAAAPAPLRAEDAWSEYTSADGRKYYFNSVTNENTWDKPRALIEKEKIAEQTPEQSAAILDAQAKAQAALAAFLAQQRSGGGGSNHQQTKAAAASGANAVAIAVADKKKDSTRPVSSTPVTGTPWCVVWTGDGKVFFYNPSTKTSVWERPPETYGREDVDELVSKPPEAKKDDPEEREAEKQALSESSDDDADGPPKAKKSRAEKKRDALIAAQKKEKEKPVRQMLEKPVDPAVQAELEAQKERDQIPLEERLNQFKAMLSERGVSTGSTFEKELSKIVFDKRYLLLSATERRACFDAYVREKTESERAEKKKKAKEAKEKFQDLLKSADLHGKSSFSSFSSKFGKDSKYKAVEKMRDREDMFNDFVGELHRKEKEEKKAKKEKVKNEFLALLTEQTGLTRKSKWSSVKKTIEEDERYKAVESSSTRESIFRDYVDKLGDETASDIEEEQEREKRLATSAALEARQKEVEAELGDQLKERNKESERHRLIEHEDRFKALLLDLVKSVDASWHDTRRQLRKDSRYEECDLLDKEKKEQYFEDHIKSLERKRRDAFFAVLNDHDKITPNMRWKEAKKIIQDEEETFSKVASNSERKVERDFRDWQERRHDALVNEFREMLKETKIITYKSKKMMEDGEQHLKDILALLENDKRWVRMTATSASERDKLLEEYIDTLHRKGTPPPPTQTEREKRRN